MGCPVVARRLGEIPKARPGPHNPAGRRPLQKGVNIQLLEREEAELAAKIKEERSGTKIVKLKLLPDHRRRVLDLARHYDQSFHDTVFACFLLGLDGYKDEYTPNFSARPLKSLPEIRAGEPFTGAEPPARPPGIVGNPDVYAEQDEKPGGWLENAGMPGARPSDRRYAPRMEMPAIEVPPEQEEEPGDNVEVEVE